MGQSDSGLGVAVLHAAGGWGWTAGLHVPPRHVNEQRQEQRRQSSDRPPSSSWAVQSRPSRRVSLRAFLRSCL